MIILQKITEEATEIILFEKKEESSSGVYSSAGDFIDLESVIIDNLKLTLAAVLNYSEATLVNYCSPEHINKAFVRAALCDNIALLKILRPKADINFLSNRVSALSCAISNNNIEMLKYLIDEKAELNGKKALIEAAEKGNTEIVALLIKAGVDVNETSFDSQKTPLHEAAFWGQTETVKLLLDNNAEIRRDRRNNTPLKYVNVAEIKVLLKEAVKKQLSELPDFFERKSILTQCLSEKKLHARVNIDDLANMCAAFSRECINAWVEHTHAFAKNNNFDMLTMQQFIYVHLAITTGRYSLEEEIDVAVKKIVALHEIGHALIAHSTGHTPDYICILKSSHAHGITIFSNPKLPDERLRINLGGMVAEKMFGISSCGSDSDLESAKKYARKMIRNNSNEHVNMADKTEEINAILTVQEAKVMNLLKQNKTSIDKLVDILVKNSYMSKQDFLDILSESAIFEEKQSISQTLTLS